MHPAKRDLGNAIDTSGKDVISDFGDISTAKKLDTIFYSSIGMKSMKGSGCYFSIDFSDASLRKGDYCKYNKTSEMRANEFWEGLTNLSKNNLREIIQTAKSQGLPNISAKMDALNLMFKKPDVVLGDQAIDMSSFIFSMDSGDVLLTNFSKTYTMRRNCVRRFGEISPIAYIDEKVASLSTFSNQQQFICSGQFSSGSVKLWDHSIGKQLIQYRLVADQSTAQQISKQDFILAVLDSTNYISIFDIRQANAVHVIRGLSQKPVSINSFELNYNQLLLGTPEGPIVLPVNYPSHQDIEVSGGDAYKSLFISRDLIATAQLGSEELIIVNNSTGNSETLNLPGEQIVDLAANPSKTTMAVISTSSMEKKHYLRLVKREKSGFEWNEYVKTTRFPQRVHFSKDDELLVVDEEFFNVYGTSNTNYVQCLKEKLSRYLSLGDYTAGAVLVIWSFYR